MREALVVWGLVLLGLAVFKVAVASWMPWGGEIMGALAVGAFLWAPGWANERAGRPDEDYGLNRNRWTTDVAWAVGTMLVVFPLFVAGFRGFLWALDHWIDPHIARMLTPYGTSTRFVWRPPSDLLNKVAGNIAIAIGEEFFYRGYIQRRLSEAWPAKHRLLGAPFGKAILLQTTLFAAGHLLDLQPFRLGTFFPGLLFGWLALRSGGVVAGAIVHAASNLLIATLEASAFGR